MAGNENTGDEPLEERSNTEIEKPSAEINATLQQTNATQNPLTEEMEVHHHPHVEKKRFKEYLLEGIMIFVAVTMGFFAESIREHLTDREREKRNVASIIKSTALDTVHLIEIIASNQHQIEGLDSFISIRNEDITQANVKWMYYYYVFKYGLSDYYFLPNNAGIEQLKSSGGLSLINEQSVADSIQSYDNFNKTISLQEQDSHVVLQQLLDLELKVIDIAVLKDHSINWNNTLDKKSDDFIKKLKAINNDPVTLKQFFGYATTLSLTNGYYVYLLKSQLQRSRNLILFLKGKYHLE